MTVKSLKKQLAASIAMTLVATVALGSSTYAWFSMNNSVSVTGMQVKTTVNKNLLIAPATNDTTKATLNAPTAAMPTSDQYSTYLIQEVGTLLEPVSSATGLYNSFWYTSTTNVVSDGNTKDNVFTQYPVDQSADDALDDFNSNYNTSDAVGYFDYVFALQATNSGDTEQYIHMNKCDITYNGNDTSGLAFRAALLVQEVNDAGTEAAATATTVTVLGVKDGDAVSDYFGAANTKASDDAVSGTSTFATVEKFGSDATVNATAIAARTTEYYKCTLRVWLEGEDTTCNNTTYAQLTNNWSIDLGFTLDAAKVDAEKDNKPVAAITKRAMTAYSVPAATGNATVVSGTTFYTYSATGTTLYSDKPTIAAGNTTGAKFYIFNDTLTNATEVTDFVTVTE